MQSTPSTFDTWADPDPGDLGDDYIEFVKKLSGPTWITLSGEDDTRSRAIVTLLHGNEPSGLKALHTFLKSSGQPATRLGIFIASVNAALLLPLFSHRFLPEERDFNRCFAPPYRTDQDKLARSLLEALESFSPEAVIDAHNTSAHSDPFAVATADNAQVRQLAGLFTRKLVVIDRKLGTLIEHTSQRTPIVTVEFGGFMDPRADTLAVETIANFATRSRLFDAEPPPLQVLKHPLRLELDPGARIHYSSTVTDDADITVFNTIDQLNFCRVAEHTSLGWLGPGGTSALKVMNASGENLIERYFDEDDGFLVTVRPMTLFMATTDPYIAQKDCLLYLTPDKDI